MKKILALVLAAVMMLSVVAFAEPSITIDDTVTVDNTAITVIVDEDGVAALAATYALAADGEVLDGIAVIASSTEAATVTFTLKAALEGEVSAVVVAGEYAEAMTATVNADGSVTVEFTAEAMTALTNGGYVLFVTK